MVLSILLFLFALLAVQIDGKERVPRTIAAHCVMRTGATGICQTTGTCFQQKVMEAISSGQSLYWADVDKCTYTSPEGQLQQGACCAGVRYSSIPHLSSTSLVASSYPLTLVQTHAQWPYISHSVQPYPLLPHDNTNSTIEAHKKQFVLIPPGGLLIPSLPGSGEGDFGDSRVDAFPGPPWIPGVNWPPPIPTHPPDHTIPPLPTHPPGLLPAGVFPNPQPATTQQPEPLVTEGPAPPTSAPAPTLAPVHPQLPGFPGFPGIPGWPGGILIPWPPAPQTVNPPKPTQPPISPGATNSKCGVRGNLGGKVVGGHPAAAHSWPWLAGLFLGNRLFCGGSLIDEYHVLTAAHCLKGMTTSALTVRLGDHDTSTTSDGPHVAVRVASIRIHPSYNHHNNQNDVALIQLASKVTFSETIIPVCLAPHGDPTDYTDKTVTVAGWGSLGWKQPVTPTLHQVDLRVWSNSKCASSFVKFFKTPGPHIVDHMICAGQFAKDSCTGDSGGPLMIQKGNQWIQLGVVSWGIQCGSKDLPGVYTRVSHFRNWIDVNRGV